MNDNSVGTVGVAVVLLIVVTAGAFGAFQFIENDGGNDDVGTTEGEVDSDGDGALESAGDDGDGDSNGNESAGDGNGTDDGNATNGSETDRSPSDDAEADGEGDGPADEDAGTDERDSDTGATETDSNESVGSQENGEDGDDGDESADTDPSENGDQSSDDGTVEEANEQESDSETAGEQEAGDETASEQEPDNETADEQESDNETADEPDYPGGMQVEVVDLPPQLNTEGQTSFGVAVRSPVPESGEAVLRLDGEVVDTAAYTTEENDAYDYAEGSVQFSVDDPDVEVGETYSVTIETDHGDRSFDIAAREPLAP